MNKIIGKIKSLACLIFTKRRTDAGEGTEGLGERITTVTATLLELFDVKPPKNIEKASREVLNICDGKKIDRAVIYNPDAIAWWLFEKYKDRFEKAIEISDIYVQRASVMPSVTPVCFASMYTGLLPKYHGIRAYKKPVLKCKTIFDYMLENGKKCCIVSTSGDSISKIFLERDMDYFIYDSIEEVNQKALEVLDSDYDLVVIYNGNYNAKMHKFGPESEEAISALDENLEFYCKLIEKIKSSDKTTFFGFCPDHGCHEIDGECGSHGLDTYEDMNVVHIYGVS